MPSTSTFLSIIAMISNFTTLFIFHIFISKFFYTYITNFLHFYMIRAFLLLITSFFKKSFISLGALLSIHKALYTSCFFSMFLNDAIVDIEKPDRICPLTFLVDKFSESLLHPSIFSIKRSRSA